MQCGELSIDLSVILIAKHMFRQKYAFISQKIGTVQYEYFLASFSLQITVSPILFEVCALEIQ
jgi:hypothetical protein